MIGAEIDQAGVGRNVIDAIGSDLAECGNLEVMNAYGLRIAFGPQLTASILEIADQFLLFGIDRDGRLVAITELFDLRIDVFKLHVTVRMGRTLPRFLVGMKAEAELPQQPANQFPARSETTFSQSAHKMTLASADPQQERLGIPTDRRLHYLLERFRKPRLSLGLRLATASQSTNASPRTGIRASQFRKTASDRAARHPCRCAHRGHTAPSRRLGLRCREQAAGALVQIGRERFKTHLDRGNVYHPASNRLHRMTESDHIERV